MLHGSRIALCLDTGHLLIGGTDPVALAEQAGDRIAHVHAKDVDHGLAAQVRAGDLTYTEAVAPGMYRPLGDGDVDFAAVGAALTGTPTTAGGCSSRTPSSRGAGRRGPGGRRAPQRRPPPGHSQLNRYRVWVYGSLPKESTLTGATPKTSPVRPAASPKWSSATVKSQSSLDFHSAASRTSGRGR